jgi:hypothetical protein
MQVAQTAACNRLHDIQQRLSRWLLMTQDRVNLGLLPITHDFEREVPRLPDSSPGKRRNRKSEVLGLDLSGNPTYQSQ